MQMQKSKFDHWWQYDKTDTNKMENDVISGINIET